MNFVSQHLKMQRQLWTPYFLLICFFTYFTLSTPLFAQDDTFNQEEARKQLEVLNQEIEAEKQHLQKIKDTRKAELKKREAERKELATQIFELTLEEQTLQKKSQALQEQHQTLQEKSTHPKTTLQKLIQASRTFSEQLQIQIQEIPSDQSLHQKTLLALENLKAESEEADPSKILLGLENLTSALELAYQSATSVRLTNQEIRTAGGLVEKVQLLSIGHVGFIYQTLQDKRIGLALHSPLDASGFRWTEKLSSDLIENIKNSIERFSTGQNTALAMDVTGNLRPESLSLDKNLMGYFLDGGPLMYPLLLIALLAFLLISERVWVLFIFNTLHFRTLEHVLKACQDKDWKSAELQLQKSRGLPSRILASCINNRDKDLQTTENIIQEKFFAELPKLRRFLNGLGILAMVSPLLGLLGTVTGIIDTFSTIQTSGETNSALMGRGISEALITTATGLTIAIPILLLRAFLRGRIDKLVSNTERYASALLNTFAHKE